MLPELATVAVVAMLADLAGNDETRSFTRPLTWVFVLVAIAVPELLGSVSSWVWQAMIGLI